MKTLHEKTAFDINQEMENIPEKYAADFNSTHEGYAVILEEVRELEHEVFFGEKECRKKFEKDLNPEYCKKSTQELHKKRMREECIQIAAMCARFIQELT